MVKEPAAPDGEGPDEHLLSQQLQLQTQKSEEMQHQVQMLQSLLNQLEKKADLAAAEVRELQGQLDEASSAPAQRTA